MSFDLSDLNISDLTQAADTENKLLVLNIEDVLEDENNPRQSDDFDQEGLQEMARSIAAKGHVLVPVGVIPHPEQKGKWILQHGARRFRATKMAGVATIRALQQELDPYDKVLENKQRKNLGLYSMALFIAERLAEGATPKMIAEKLATQESFVSRHRGLLEAPEPILALIKNKQLADAEAAQILIKMFAQNAAATIAYISSKGVERISQAELRKLKVQLQEENQSRLPEVKKEHVSVTPAVQQEPHEIKRTLVEPKLPDLGIANPAPSQVESPQVDAGDQVKPALVDTVADQQKPEVHDPESKAAGVTEPEKPPRKVVHQLANQSLSFIHARMRSLLNLSMEGTEEALAARQVVRALEFSTEPLTVGMLTPTLQELLGDILMEHGRYTKLTGHTVLISAVMDKNQKNLIFNQGKLL